MRVVQRRAPAGTARCWRACISDGDWHGLVTRWHRRVTTWIARLAEAFGVRVRAYPQAEGTRVLLESPLDSANQGYERRAARRWIHARFLATKQVSRTTSDAQQENRCGRRVA